AVAQVIDGALVLWAALRCGEVQRQGKAAADLDEARDQRFVDRVELVGTGGEGAGLALALQPVPLEERGLEQRCRSVVVELVQLCRPTTVVGEVDPAVEVRIAPPP